MFAGAIGLLGNYTPAPFNLEMQRLFINYSVLLIFPLWYYADRIGKHWIWSWKTWILPTVVLFSIGCFYLIVGGNGYTPYLPWEWSNLAVMSWSVFFVIVIYCYSKLNFSPIHGFIATCGSVVVASWLYELVDPAVGNTLQYISPYNGQINWVLGAILIALVHSSYENKLKTIYPLAIGLLVFELSQVPYIIFHQYLTGAPPTSMFPVYFFNNFYIYIIRLTTIPLFAALPLIRKP